MSKSENILENGRIAQKELEEVVNMALSTLKSLMADYETPIEIRLRVALEIFELFGKNPDKNKITNEEGVIRSIEKNAYNIEKNALKLSQIETLLKMAVEHKNPESVLRDGGRIINH